MRKCSPYTLLCISHAVDEVLLVFDTPCTNTVGHQKDNKAKLGVPGDIPKQ